MANFNCPMCKAHAQYVATPASSNPDGISYGQPVVNAWVQCTSCTRIVGGVMDSRSRTQLVDFWPRNFVRRSFTDVPPHIASAASEAYLCWGAGAHRAAGAMARAVLEATAKEKGFTEGQIYKKIEALHEAGLLRDHVREAAHEVRHFGNDMSHGDFVEEVDADEAEAVLELMSEVLNEVFQSPARVAAMRAARLAKKDKLTS